jgi:hypothetical protein
MSFCKNCNNLLDISKTQPKNVQQNPDINVQELIEGILAKDDKMHAIVKTININDIYKHPFFTNLSPDKKLLVEHFMEKNVGHSLNKAYYICSNCLYSSPIEPNALIASKASTNISKSYVKSEKFKNYIYNPALPRTRNYACVNEDCISHKQPDKKEAVFYRQCVNNLQIWYSCCACNGDGVWKG